MKNQYWPHFGGALQQKFKEILEKNEFYNVPHESSHPISELLIAVLQEDIEND